MSCKIKINREEKALVNGHSGEVLRPDCFDTLVLYHSYLVQRGYQDRADEILRRVFKGEKVISDMIKQAQELDLS
jgi:hypothetical protein